MTPAVAVQIPSGAWRRSWLVQASRGARAGLQMAALIRRLDPAARPDPWKPQACYEALIAAAADRFPVYDMDGAYDDVEYLFDYGIPIAPIGFGLDTARTVTAFVAADLDWADYGGHVEPARILDVYPALEGLDLRWWTGPARNSDDGSWDVWAVRLPRGRAWTGVWAAMPDLVDYVLGRTGNGWLDWSPEEVDEGGQMPAWNMGEIRACERTWQMAQAAWKRIEALTHHIESDLQPNLQLLDRVLRGNPDALRQVTHAKRGRTLADIWR